MQWHKYRAEFNLQCLVVYVDSLCTAIREVRLNTRSNTPQQQQYTAPAAIHRTRSITVQHMNSRQGNPVCGTARETAGQTEPLLGAAHERNSGVFQGSVY